MFKTKSTDLISSFVIIAITILTTVSFAQAKTVNAAKYSGFNPNNATKALQSALDSGADKVIVPDVGKPWIVTPIELRSNQTVVFKPGVIILAKKGEFKSRSASLFTARGVKNLKIIGNGATWRMHKKDYDNPKKYRHAEWRMGLALRGCTNVTIEGLTIEKTGGDGIYIAGGEGKSYSENVIINNVVLNDNYRQGISVIGVDKLLIENTVMRDTSGTPPAAGIDFEPNNNHNRLSNIVMKNCITKSNQGRGYIVSIRGLDATSEPVSILFKNCKSIGDHSSAVSIVTNDTAANVPSGNIKYIDCDFIKSERGGITIRKPADKLGIIFKNCVLNNPSLKHKLISPIAFSNAGKGSGPIGGVHFDNFAIKDPEDRQPISYVVRSGQSPLKNVTGTLIISGSKGTSRLKLTQKLLDKWFPPKQFEFVPYIPLDDVQWSFDNNPSANDIKLKKAKIRITAHYALLAHKNENVKLHFYYGQIGKYKGTKLQVSIIDPAGKKINTDKITFKKNSPIKFIAPKDGLYLLTIKPGGNYVRLESSTNPIGLITPKGGFDFYKSAGTYYFWVPKGTKKFAVQGVGKSREGLRMILKSPNGDTVKNIDNIIGLKQITVTPSSQQTGKIWILQIRSASDVYFEDHSIKLLGVPPILSASPKAVIRSK